MISAIVQNYHLHNTANDNDAVMKLYKYTPWALVIDALVVGGLLTVGILGLNDTFDISHKTSTDLLFYAGGYVLLGLVINLVARYVLKCKVASIGKKAESPKAIALSKQIFHTKWIVVFAFAAIVTLGAYLAASWTPDFHYKSISWGKVEWLSTSAIAGFAGVLGLHLADRYQRNKAKEARQASEAAQAAEKLKPKALKDNPTFAPGSIVAIHEDEIC